MGRYFFWTFVAVLAGIFAWSRLAPKLNAPKNTRPNNTVPVDTGYFFGPNVDPATGAYLEPGATGGTIGYPNAPIGMR